MSFGNLKVSVRLGIGFGGIILLLAALATVGLRNMASIQASLERIVNTNQVKTKLINDMSEAIHVVSRVLRTVVILEDEAAIKQQQLKIVAARKSYDEALEALEKMPATDAAKAIRARMRDAENVARPLNNKVLELGLAHKVAEAGKVLMSEAGPATQVWQDVLHENLKLQEQNSNQDYEAARSAYQGAQVWMYALSGIAVLISLLAAYAITRSIMRQVGGEPADAMRIANNVAAGDLSKEINLRAGDTQSLMAAMSRMQSAIKDIVAAQIEMRARHDEGTISFRIDTSRFAGSYADMAQQTNDLVAAHIAVKMRVVAVVNQYAKGDLSVDMDRLPGEKARITEVIDGVKASLLAVNTELRSLVDAASRGDFTVRGDEAKFEYEFRKMVAGLNQLMQTSDTGLREVSRVFGALAKGDLTDKMSGDYQGTFAQLKQDCNQTVENLTAIVNQIKEASDTIDTASKEITQGNTDLSQRTEEQASSLEETASSMEELTSTVKQNAENARQANQLAVGASDVAVKGGDVVKQVVTTMSGISESSKKIADIIGVIDGIAFQTNILALNAAVEAARAGEQGRGFAVVATEVRNLAQRSANAAKEIKGLITDSVSRVDTGTELVDEAGKTMEDIVTSVKRVTDIMAEITAASQEQSSGIEQVNQAITQMDEVTQQNAALVEEAAAAAESMQEQAATLVRTMNTFTLQQPAGVAMAERRGPDRAVNVARLPKKAAANKPVAKPAAKAPAVKKAVGADEDWQEF